MADCPHPESEVEPFVLGHPLLVCKRCRRVVNGYILPAAKQEAPPKRPTRMAMFEWIPWVGLRPVK